MAYEKSCGAVLYTRVAGELRYVLIQQLTGFWGLPKGQVEGEETEEETALREIFEEVHIRASLMPGFRTVDEYPLPNQPNVMKQVVFFCAEYAGQELIPQEAELLRTALVPYEEALRLLDFESTRRVLREAHAFLMKEAFGGG